VIKVQGLIFRDKAQFELGEKDIPKISTPTDVLLEVKYAGICGTDLNIFWGNHPANPNTILGHEYTGIVKEVGNAVTCVKPGDKVVIDPNIKCSTCFYCRNNMENQCNLLDKGNALGIFRDGGFAKYNLAPESTVYKIPHDMPYESAVLVEPLSCIVNALNIAKIKPDDTVVVLGAGPIGLLFTNIVHHIASMTIVTELEELRIERAKKYANYVFNPKEINVEEKIKKLTDGVMGDVVIDATGVLFDDAIKLVKKGGKIILFGMNYGYKGSIHPYLITRKEIKIFGSYIANKTIMPAIKLLYHNKIDVNHYISEILPLDEIFLGFKKLGLDVEAKKKVPVEALKIVIKIGG
jgi:threonine dehydrogenase-like Zn-dependent dehydrogenase